MNLQEVKIIDLCFKVSAPIKLDCGESYVGGTCDFGPIVENCVWKDFNESGVKFCVNKEL